MAKTLIRTRDGSSTIVDGAPDGVLHYLARGPNMHTHSFAKFSAYEPHGEGKFDIYIRPAEVILVHEYTG